MPINKFSAAIAATFLLSAAAHAAPLVEDFSGGLNGFSTDGGSDTVLDSGGPGGMGDSYLSITDSSGSGSNAFMKTTFGPSWTGDLTGFDGGSFSFNYIQTNPTTGSAFLAGFGTLTVFNGGFSASVDTVPGNPSDAWQKTTVAFDAATFGVTQAQWTAILGNVSSIVLETESWGVVQETVGIDNLTLAPVPLPASALLLVGGLGALGVARRRQKS